MRNNLGHAVQIELFRPGTDYPATVGTDYVVFIDGRWSQRTAVEQIEHYVETRAHHALARGLEWRRSVYRLRHCNSVTI